MDEEALRNRIVQCLKSQGFAVNPHLRPRNNEKDTLRRVHKRKREEQLRLHKDFLSRHIDDMKKNSISGAELRPEKIDLELIEVKPDSFYSELFFWWNLVWWSIPYDRPIGRQMRFMLWDKYHNSPFGIFCLQSPPLRSAARDQFLGLDSRNVDFWINQSLYGQRIGALPPYNELLAGKMVALSLTSNEVRTLYERKYESRKTILRKRNLPNRLLFITTTSAFGRSSVYERIKYREENVSQFLGFTSGAGTFQLSEQLYEDCCRYLEQKGMNARRGYGTGPSRKMKLVSAALRHLKIGGFSYHNIRRGYYLFSNVRNLHDVIHSDAEASWYERPFDELSAFWKEHWCIPRSNRMHTWKLFDRKSYFAEKTREISKLA